MSAAYDYTKDDETTRAADFDPAEYSFLGVQAAPDVEAIEREAESREFRDIPPGDHELIVKGFKDRPKDVLRTGFLRGKQVSWTSAQVAVRIALAGDPGASVLDFFDLPPRDHREQEAYLFASSKQDGSNPGFMARKFIHFLNRLGFQFAEGEPIPQAACNLGNWVGRKVHATIVLQANKDERRNPTTGLPYPPRGQVKLFSYRPAGEAGPGTIPTARPLAPHPVGQPARPPQGERDRDEGPRQYLRPSAGGLVGGLQDETGGGFTGRPIRRTRARPRKTPGNT